jgi:rubrerythrin
LYIFQEKQTIMQIIKLGKGQIEREIERSKRIEERKNDMLKTIQNPIKCTICETVIHADPEDLIIIGDGYEYHEEYVKCPNCGNDITCYGIQ